MEISDEIDQIYDVKSRVRHERKHSKVPINLDDFRGPVGNSITHSSSGDDHLREGAKVSCLSWKYLKIIINIITFIVCFWTNGLMFL